MSVLILHLREIPNYVVTYCETEKTKVKEVKMLHVRRDLFVIGATESNKEGGVATEMCSSQTEV